MSNSASVVCPTTILPLVEIKQDQPITTSLRIAEHFQKEHSKVLRDIRNLDCSKNFQEANFGLTFYNRPLANKGYKKSPMYYITRDGFTFLAMGFTGKVAAKFKEDYINAFNAMEAKLRRMREQPNLAHYVPIQRYNQLQQMYDFQTDQVRWWTDMYSKQTKIVANLVDQMMERKAKQLQTPTWMTVVGYATLHNISCGLNMAARLGRKAAGLCALQGIVPQAIPDPRFGRVNTYPMHILEEVFNAI